jgi:hypothetical protein
MSARSSGCARLDLIGGKAFEEAPQAETLAIRGASGRDEFLVGDVHVLASAPSPNTLQPTRWTRGNLSPAVALAIGWQCAIIPLA